MPKKIPKGKSAQGMFAVNIITDDGPTEFVYEPVLGFAAINMNGEPLPLFIKIEGLFAQITADVDGALYWVNISLNTSSTIIMLGDTRLGMFTDQGSYLALWEAETKNRWRVPTAGFPQHARALIGGFLLWRYLVRRKLVESQPTH